MFFSERFVWFPAYLVLLVGLSYYFGQRARLLLPLLGLSVLLADSISSRFFKPYFARLRPCHDPQVSATLNLVDGCGGQFGFISSHAANAFALAVFLWLVLPTRFRAAKWLVVCSGPASWATRASTWPPTTPPTCWPAPCWAVCWPGAARRCFGRGKGAGGPLR